jgi:recombination protein RecT
MSNAVAKKEPEKQKQLAPIDQFKSSLELMTDNFVNVLPRNIDVVKFKAIIITAVASNDALLSVERKSLFLSCQKAAQDGLMPDGREAAIVPYKGKAQYQPMVGGIVKKIHEIVGAKITSNQIICENDYVLYEEGDTPRLVHRPAFSNRGKELAVYAVAEFENGQKVREIVPWDDVEKIKATSKATRDDAPWKIWPSEMAKKTAIRRLSKKLPITAELDRVLRRGDEDEESATINDNIASRQVMPKLTRLEAIVANNSPAQSEIEEPQESIEQFNISDWCIEFEKKVKAENDSDSLYTLWDSSEETLAKVKAEKPQFYNSMEVAYQARMKQIEGNLV